LALHARAIEGDGLALDTLCERILPELEHSLRLKARRVEREWVHDAVQEAVMEFRVNAGRFDPSRGVSLLTFLWLAAYRNLLNRVDRERRRGWRAVAADAAALEALAPFVMPDYERDIDLQRALNAVSGRLSIIERRVLHLLRRGEQSAHVLAQAAGGTELTPTEQRRLSRRIINRIFQRMRRLRDKRTQHR
jgi:hypothetical protein